MECEVCHCNINEVTHDADDPFCPSCGTEVFPASFEVPILPPSTMLPGDIFVEDVLEDREGCRVYWGRIFDGRKVRIYEVHPKSDQTVHFCARYEIGNSSFLPKIITYFGSEGREYFVEEYEDFDRPFFGEVIDVVKLVGKLRLVLRELVGIHSRGWFVSNLLREGIYERSDGTPVIGRSGYIVYKGYPISFPADHLDQKSLPAITTPCIDLLSVVEPVWSALGADDSWKEIWRVAKEESNRKKRRDIFFKALAYSPRIIEWPPLAEVLSDFLSDPRIWTARDFMERLTSNPPSFYTEVEVVSHRGFRRSNNEDSVLANKYELWLEGIPTKVSLLVVADGMGGAGGGEVASRIAVTTIDAEIHRFVNEGGLVFTGSQLKEAIEKANKAVFKGKQTGIGARDMGTTVVACLLVGMRYFIGWVGDSRAYKVIKDGRLVKLTTDHTMVAELVKTGAVAEKDAEGHPLSSKLTRAIGPREAVEVDIVSGELETGEALLFTTDGFVPALRDFEFTPSNTLKESIEALIVRMLRRGGDDNASLVMARVV